MPGRFARLHDGELLAHEIGLLRRPAQHFVRGEEIVYVSHHLHPAVGEHDQVVGEPLELGDDVGGEDHREATGRDCGHDKCHEVVARERVESCKRLVQHEEVGTARERQGQSELGLLAAGQLADLAARWDLQSAQPLFGLSLVKA